jgi:ribosomal protein S17E
MGRIKTKPIKRMALGLFNKEPAIFHKDFDSNKKVLGNEMPSKKTRNMVAGYLTRLKKNNKKILSEDE